MTTTAVGLKPTESLFYAPVIYLIGKLSGFKPYVGVHQKLIRDDAIRLAGLDLLYEEDKKGESVPVYATDGHFRWHLRSSSSKKRNGLYRTVSFGWYHQTHKYRADNPQREFCARPMDPETRGKRGYWALTALGVKRAKALREVYEGKIVLSAGPNRTAQFLGENWDRFYGKATLALRRKMPRSEALDKVDDHVMNWVEKVMQRDGLRKRLEKGISIAPSHVSGWAKKAAYTQIRNEGREPVCRIFHGALTPKEVAALNDTNWAETVIPRTVNEADVLCHNQYAAHSESDWIDDPTEAIQDEHITAQVESSVADEDSLEFCLDQVSKIIMEEVSEEHDPAFHCQLVYDRFVRELTVREIAEHHGLDFDENESRIKVALSRVRDVMLQAREQGFLDEFLIR